MFETLFFEGEQVDSEYSGYGLLGWRTVVNLSGLPWIHVTIKYQIREMGEDEIIIYNQYFDNVIDFLDAINRPGNRLLGIEYVTPGHMNGSSNWKMEALKEIWEGKEPIHNKKAYIFVVEGGKRYCNPEFEMSEEKIIGKRKVFQI